MEPVTIKKLPPLGQKTKLSKQEKDEILEKSTIPPESEFDGTMGVRNASDLVSQARKNFKAKKALTAKLNGARIKKRMLANLAQDRSKALAKSLVEAKNLVVKAELGKAWEPVRKIIAGFKSSINPGKEILERQEKILQKAKFEKFSEDLTDLLMKNVSSAQLAYNKLDRMILPSDISPTNAKTVKVFVDRLKDWVSDWQTRISEQRDLIESILDPDVLENDGNYVDEVSDQVSQTLVAQLVRGFYLANIQEARLVDNFLLEDVKPENFEQAIDSHSSVWAQHLTQALKDVTNKIEDGSALGDLIIGTPGKPGLVSTFNPEVLAPIAESLFKRDGDESDDDAEDDEIPVAAPVPVPQPPIPAPVPQPPVPVPQPPVPQPPQDPIPISDDEESNEEEEAEEEDEVPTSIYQPLNLVYLQDIQDDIGSKSNQVLRNVKPGVIEIKYPDQSWGDSSAFLYTTSIEDMVLLQRGNVLEARYLSPSAFDLILNPSGVHKESPIAVQGAFEILTSVKPESSGVPIRLTKDSQDLLNLITGSQRRKVVYNEAKEAFKRKEEEFDLILNETDKDDLNDQITRVLNDENVQGSGLETSRYHGLKSDFINATLQRVLEAVLEMQAGNTSNVLKKETAAKIHKLASKGILSSSEAVTLLKKIQ